MNLDNVMTYKTKGINIAYDCQKSLVNFPANEDWQLVVKVYNIENGLIRCKKIWDRVGGEKIFNVRLKYIGKSGIPPESCVKIGETIIINRVGDYNSTGESCFELHVEAANKYSFVHFVNAARLCYVKDIGNGTGQEIAFDEAGQPFIPTGSEILPLKSIEPPQYYHNTAPPFAEGRIYTGQKKVNHYLVFLSGHGRLEKQFNVTLHDGSVISLDVDGQGNLLDFKKSE